jgi:hypothetical protein
MRRKVIVKGSRWDGKSLTKALDETESHWQRLSMRWKVIVKGSRWDGKSLSKALDETESHWQRFSMRQKVVNDFSSHREPLSMTCRLIESLCQWLSVSSRAFVNDFLSHREPLTMTFRLIESLCQWLSERRKVIDKGSRWDEKFVIIKQ